MQIQIPKEVYEAFAAEVFKRGGFDSSIDSTCVKAMTVVLFIDPSGSVDIARDIMSQLKVAAVSVVVEP